MENLLQNLIDYGILFPAIVSWFNIEKRYGFLTAEGISKDVRLFFHHNDARCVEVGLSGKEPNMVPPNGTSVEFPLPGEELMVVFIETEKGIQAKPWCFKTDWDWANEEAQIPLCRLMTQIMKFGKWTIPYPVWEGRHPENPSFSRAWRAWRQLNLHLPPEQKRAWIEFQEEPEGSWALVGLKPWEIVQNPDLLKVA